MSDSLEKIPQKKSKISYFFFAFFAVVALVYNSVRRALRPRLGTSCLCLPGTCDVFLFAVGVVQFAENEQSKIAA